MSVPVTVAFVFLAVVMLGGIVAILYAIRRYAEMVLEAVESQAEGTARELTGMRVEMSLRLAALHTGEEARNQTVAEILKKLATLNTSVGLIPDGMEALRSQIQGAIEKLEENAIPEDTTPVTAAAMHRIRSVREDMERASEDTLKKLRKAAEESAKAGEKFSEPLIRVRGGD